MTASVTVLELTDRELELMKHALRSYLSDFGHDEADVGRLAPGLRADFVVLDRDPLAVPAAELDDLKIRATWVDGQAVYQAE